MAAIGIDLGTTNCCVAYAGQNGIPEVIINNLGQRTTPSVVDLSSDIITVGKAAKNKMHRFPDKIISGMKYIIGRQFEDAEVQQFVKTQPFRILQKNDKIKIVSKETHNEEDEYTPEEIYAVILKSLKKFTEERLGTAVDKAVITVPTHFMDSQRQATIDAGKVAGFSQIKLINEPVAAALAYGVGHSINDAYILVFDFGGGTFDVSIINCKNNVYTEIGIHGDLHLGGNDIDEKMVQFLQQKINANNEKKMIRLRKKCELAKIDLTSLEEYILDIDDENDIIIKRTEFNKEIEEILEKLMKIVQQCLIRSQLATDDITTVLLVGGSSRIPAVEECIIKMFNRKINKTVNPDEAVAVGAAISAAMWKNVAYEDIKLKTIVPNSIGLEIKGTYMRIMIRQFTQLPCSVRCEKIYPENDGADVCLRVFCGEDNLTENNTFIGELEFQNITQAPDGIRWLVVIFELDTDCILKVSAEDTGGKKSKMTMNINKGNLSNEEIAFYKAKIERKLLKQ